MAMSKDGQAVVPTLRPVRPGDEAAVFAITAAVFAPASIDAKIEALLGRPAASWQEIKTAAVARELQANPGGCFVAEREGKVLGYVTTVIHEKASRGLIANLAVAAEAQGLGIGRRLIERALEHFRQLGLAQAKIETLACNEVGRHLYPALGFQELVRQVHYVMPLIKEGRGTKTKSSRSGA